MQREKLRVTLPINFGRAVVAPHLAMFLERHPELDIEYLLTNAQSDPIEHRIDVALWIDGGAWIDSRLVIEHVSTSATLLCAAPAYLENFGTPRTIADLEQHRTLAAVDEQTGYIWPWTFEHDGTRIPFSPANGFHSNGIEVLAGMAMQGLGIVYLPDYIAAEPVRQGRLRVVLPKFRLVPSAVRILYPRSHAGKPGVMAFVGLLSEIIKAR
jgi:DNA-binding transcriptional LysR family regulator